LPVTASIPRVRLSNIIIPLSEYLKRFAPHITFLSIILMVLSGVAFVITPQIADGQLAYPTTGLLLALLGSLSLGAAIYLSHDSGCLPDFRIVTDQPISPSRIAWLPVIIGAVMLAFVAEISGQVIDPPIFVGVSARLQWLLLWLGIGLIVWGLSGMPRPRLPRIERWDLLAIVGIFVFALIIRLWGLDTTLRVLLDEMHFVNSARTVEVSPNLRILVPMTGTASYPWLYSLLQADIEQLFGRNLTGLRATTAFLGALNVIALYFLARTLFDRKTALIASVLLITFPFHLHHSRITQHMVGDLLFGMLALAFFVRGIKYNRSLDWSLAGASLGLAQYFYDGGRLLFPVLIFSWIVFALMTWQGRWRNWRQGLFIMVVGAVLVGAPVAYGTVADGKPFLGRLDASGMGAPYWQAVLQDGISQQELQIQAERLVRSFLLYVFLPEQPNVHTYFYGGTEPLVLRPFTPLFLLGTFYVLWRGRSAGFIAFLWVIAVALSIGLLIRANMLTSRFVVVGPALALMMAVGIRYIPPLLRLETNRSLHRANSVWRQHGLAIFVVALISMVHLYYYFGPHLENLNATQRRVFPWRDGWDVVLRTAELPYRTQAVVVGTQPFPILTEMRIFQGYLQYRDRFPIESYETSQITPEFLVNLPRDRNYAFFIQPSELDVFNQIYRIYPEAQPPSYTTTAMMPNEEFVLVYVPLLPDEAANRRW
jgi:4-amino-4-deoxy-L-arabinose transferase-like glycosyltransferase